MKPETSKLVYLSHSPTDQEWLNRLLLALAPYERDSGLEIFSDTRSVPSEESWDQARENMLRKAVVVVVLLSRDCLDPRFLTHYKWPRIWAAVNAGLPLVVVPINLTEIPQAGTLKHDPRQKSEAMLLPEWLTLDRHHWAGDHRIVLENLSEGELTNAFTQIARKIAMATGTAITPRRIRIPDIAWVEIPGGTFIYQEGEARQLPTFWIAKYPITNMQYQCFIDDGGYREERWWQGLKRPAPADSRWPQSNRPRTDVNWHEAVAFSRWLCARLGLREGEIRLPTEEEWERAARGTEGLAYPWGAEYRSGHANVNEKMEKAGPWALEQTTAVGVYPHGRSPEGVEDMAGTVWEWCLNKYEKPEQIEVDESDDWRVLRGGSWILDPVDARADDRGWNHPDLRDLSFGFRLLSSVPISTADR